MDSELAYCPACRRTVHLAPATDEGRRDLVCLESGAACPAGTCPLTGAHHVVMALRLALAARTFSAGTTCAGCGRYAEMAMVERQTLRCPGCGAINRWESVVRKGTGWVVG